MDTNDPAALLHAAQQLPVPSALAVPRQPKARAQQSASRGLSQLGQPGFVLHRYPYRETSLIVEVFCREQGRVALVAKGAKRAHSALRGVLQTFVPLVLSWSGKSEMHTLTRAEWLGGMRPLVGMALLCGFYVNELLVKFCAREDPHERLFDHYVLTLHRLAQDALPTQALRSFERVLLRETGYAGSFDRTARGAERVCAERDYVFIPGHGVCEMDEANAGDKGVGSHPRISGQTLIDIEADDYSSARTLAQSKTLMRFLLNAYLGGAPLNTRQILLDLQNV
jgi:DNA repair protein RecO (recombination protein O)